MKYNVIIAKGENGIFVAECLDLPRCAGQGKTRAEALTNIRNAIRDYLQILENRGEKVPRSEVEINLLKAGCCLPPKSNSPRRFRKSASKAVRQAGSHMVL